MIYERGPDRGPSHIDRYWLVFAPTLWPVLNRHRQDRKFECDFYNNHLKSLDYEESNAWLTYIPNGTQSKKIVTDHKKMCPDRTDSTRYPHKYKRCINSTPL